MRFHKSRFPRFTTLAVFVLLTAGPSGFGQENRPGNQPRDAGYNSAARAVASGQKMKLKGTIERREGETFSIRDERNIESIVLLTDRTSVKSKGGFFRSGKNYDVTSLLRGLNVEVDGVGNQQGQIVADKVRFDSSDLKFARMVDTRVSPVEQANQRLSGQVDELGEVSKLARNEAGRQATHFVSTAM